LKILDIGTGSGAIAISLAKALPNASVEALDVSEKALRIAKLNSKENNLTIRFYKKNILNTKHLDMNYDIIVSNPPYVRLLEKKEINNNVLQYEPHTALFVTNQAPLLFYSKITELALKHLNPKGVLYFEINQYLGKETLNLIKTKGFQNIELKQDFKKNDRMIKAVIP
jgi:release factor glutamine methyltransferase